MRGLGRRLAWVNAALLVPAGGVLLWAVPAVAPLAVLPALGLAFVSLAAARRAARGTALGAALVWAGVALGLGAAAEALAWLEPLSAGRPAAGHVTYLCTLAALAALISVLNARTPGGGAWAILMALLVLVFLIPWLEAAGLGAASKGLARLRLDSPWSIFYGLLVTAGVTNYLPTRYGPAAAWLVVGFVLEYLALRGVGWPPAARGAVWPAVPWALAAAAATAEVCSRPRSPAPAPAPGVGAGAARLDAAWFWFRDHWGAVWAAPGVLERFNRSAEASGWPVRLTWQGLANPTGAAVPPAAEATFRGLIRRFAAPDRVDLAVGPG